jgi:hypothetical protein
MMIWQVGMIVTARIEHDVKDMREPGCKIIDATLQDAILISLKGASSSLEPVGLAMAGVWVNSTCLVSGKTWWFLGSYHLPARACYGTQVINHRLSRLATFNMGRARAKAKKSVPIVTNPSRSSSSSATPAISALLDKAQELIVQCDFPLARKFIERVLVRDDGSVSEKNQAREMMGVVLLETGEVDKAREASGNCLL